MAIDNWKLWLVPFAFWGLAMAWYTGYQSGYQDGHATAWESSRAVLPLSLPTDQLVLSGEPDRLDKK